jgi:hypothetical protein
MKQQNMEWDIILWLEATTNEARWITDGFLVPARLIKDGQAGPIRISRTEGSLNKNTRIIKEKGRGINQKQFTKILNKASQPIKKSEK